MVRSERADIERDEGLKRVRAQADEWRVRARQGQVNARAMIAAGRAAARAAKERTTRVQRAAAAVFEVRVAEQRKNAARVVERFNRKRGRA